MTVSGPEKIFYISIGVLFLMMGVIGLIIPIIPGVLFLAGAVYMLSRGSSRVREYAENHPKLSGMQKRMDQMDAISMVEKAQVAGLVFIQTVVSGSRKVYFGIRRMVV